MNYNEIQKENENGITLVSLVVTIIVLLILSSISIYTAISNNGIMSKAKDASNTWKNSEDSDKIATQELKNDLITLREARETAGGGSESSITDYDGSPIDLDNIVDYYGRDIIYNNKRYQLFYADISGKYSNGEPRLWLQHKSYVTYDSTTAPFNISEISNLNSNFWKLNPDLKKECGEEVSAKSTNDLGLGIKRASSLSNPMNWNSTYVSSTDLEKGVYATGGVSVEMYCDSYNQAREKIQSDEDYFKVKAFKVNGTYGYGYFPYKLSLSNGYGYYTDANNYPILPTTRDGMYRLTDQSTFLASPATTVSDTCFVYGVAGSLNHNYFVNVSCGLRPAISVPVDFPIQFEEE